MRMYLISDNTDTLTGMRLAGSERCIRSWLRQYAQNIKSRFSSKSRTATEQDGGPISSRHM